MPLSDGKFYFLVHCQYNKTCFYIDIQCVYVYIIIGNVHTLTYVPLLDFGKQGQLPLLSSW